MMQVVDVPEVTLLEHLELNTRICNEVPVRSLIVSRYEEKLQTSFNDTVLV